MPIERAPHSARRHDGLIQRMKGINMTRTLSRRITTHAFILTVIAGAPASALAQQNHDDRAHPASRAVTDTTLTRSDFFKSGALVGADVTNRNGETIGSVTDFIIDRGSGEITEALIKSGATLGVGGKTIAVPYARLGWDRADGNFTLQMTPEQIDRAVEFDPETWPNLDHTTWTESVERWWTGEEAGGDSARAGRAHANGGDDTAMQIREAKRERLKGTITDVRREREHGQESVIAIVRTDDNEQREVILGPSWFVMGSAAAPMRGDEIEAETAPVSRSGDTLHVVTSATIDGQRLSLRNAQGEPQWNVPSESASTGDRRAAGRLILLSDLVGSKAVSSSDKDAGEIQNVVIERRSGSVAILGYDPNENFLGLGDEIKCVPWSIARVGADGTVRIDATDEALSGCEPMPDDVTMFETQAKLAPVYRVFGVEPERFNPRQGADATTRRMGADKERAFYASIAEGETVNLAGDVVEVSTKRLGAAVGPARVVTISTDQGKRTVILGPEWYLANQPLDISEGDQVSVRARRGTVQGAEHYVAWSINTPDRQVSFWDGDEPVWNDG